MISVLEFRWEAGEILTMKKFRVFCRVISPPPRTGFETQQRPHFEVTETLNTAGIVANKASQDLTKTLYLGAPHGGWKAVACSILLWRVQQLIGPRRHRLWSRVAYITGRLFVVNLSPMTQQPASIERHIMSTLRDKKCVPSDAQRPGPSHDERRHVYMHRIRTRSCNFQK